MKEHQTRSPLFMFLFSHFLFETVQPRLSWQPAQERLCYLQSAQQVGPPTMRHSLSGSNTRQDSSITSFAESWAPYIRDFLFHPGEKGAIPAGGHTSLKPDFAHRDQSAAVWPFPSIGMQPNFWRRRQPTLPTTSPHSALFLAMLLANREVK